MDRRVAEIGEDSRDHHILLGEIADLLKSEMELVDESRWEELPGLKRQKVFLASQLRALNQPNVLRGSPIPDLEAKARQKMKTKLDFLGDHILTMQEIRQYCAECLNVSFQKYG